jgi:RHS repeat-associated protein
VTTSASSSVTTDANGVKTASALYKAFGETRFSAGNLGTDYKFTGQREEASLGIYYFNARWFDPSLGRFTSPDSIVPTSTQGTQAWDRYAFVNNNPVRYNDPTGHTAVADQDQSHENGQCDDSVTDCESGQLIPPLPPQKLKPCNLLECVLSAVSAIASVGTMDPVTLVPAMIIDVIVTIPSMILTLIDWEQGEISDLRFGLLEGTAFVGLWPGPLGVFLSVANFFMTATGMPN